MNTLVSNAIATFISYLKRLQLGRAVAAVVVSSLIMATLTYNPAGAAAATRSGTDDASLGERFRDRIEQTDRHSERPKTTGDFVDE
ncbi:MAG TPA: hypothetical protein V6C57_13405, partial [Coleofasciculaceae cyanobacterium]